MCPILTDQNKSKDRKWGQVGPKSWIWFRLNGLRWGLDQCTEYALCFRSISRWQSVLRVGMIKWTHLARPWRKKYSIWQCGEVRCDIDGICGQRQERLSSGKSLEVVVAQTDMTRPSLTLDVIPGLNTVRGISERFTHLTLEEIYTL